MDILLLGLLQGLACSHENDICNKGHFLQAGLSNHTSVCVCVCVCVCLCVKTCTHEDVCVSLTTQLLLLQGCPAIYKYNIITVLQCIVIIWLVYHFYSIFISVQRAMSNNSLEGRFIYCVFPSKSQSKHSEHLKLQHLLKLFVRPVSFALLLIYFFIWLYFIFFCGRYHLILILSVSSMVRIPHQSFPLLLIL